MAGAHRRVVDFDALHCPAQRISGDLGARAARAAGRFMTLFEVAQGIGELQRIAAQCDGVRCDMAMLVLPDVFQSTGGHSR